MFKKRIRLATVLFAVVLVMTVVCVGFLAATKKQNGVETQFSVLYGDK